MAPFGKVGSGLLLRGTCRRERNAYARKIDPWYTEHEMHFHRAAPVLCPWVRCGWFYLTRENRAKGESPRCSAAFSASPSPSRPSPFRRAPSGERRKAGPTPYAAATRVPLAPCAKAVPGRREVARRSRPASNSPFRRRGETRRNLPPLTGSLEPVGPKTPAADAARPWSTSFPEGRGARKQPPRTAAAVSFCARRGIDLRPGAGSEKPGPPNASFATRGFSDFFLRAAGT